MFNDINGFWKQQRSGYVVNTVDTLVMLVERGCVYYKHNVQWVLVRRLEILINCSLLIAYTNSNIHDQGSHS